LELINHAKRPGERIPTGKNNLEIKKKKKPAKYIYNE
jgi:hypothetical protein